MGTCGSCGFSMRGGRIESLYAFDPKRAAILLVGGDKTGDHRWYEAHVPLADRLYDEHLKALESEAKKHGKTL